MKPAISILLPTRGRLVPLDDSLTSLRDLAADPDSLEVVARYDDDDPATGDALPSILRQWKAPIILGGERWGYKRGHDYYNQVAAAATGDLLMLWNDDAIMLTRHWDVLLREALPFSVQFLRRDIFEQADITFPVIGRPVHRALGHLSLNAHVDLWLGEISFGDGEIHDGRPGAGIGRFRNDIEIHHYRLNDQTSIDRDQNYDLSGFSSDAMRAAREEDVRRLLAMKSQYE